MNEGGFIFLSEQELQGAPIMKALLSTEKKNSLHSRVGAVDGARLAYALLIRVLPDGHVGEVWFHTTGAASHTEG